MAIDVYRRVWRARYQERIKGEAGISSRQESVAVCCSVLQCVAVCCSVLQVYQVDKSLRETTTCCCRWKRGADHRTASMCRRTSSRRRRPLFPFICVCVFMCVREREREETGTREGDDDVWSGLFAAVCLQRFVCCYDVCSALDMWVCSGLYMWVCSGLVALRRMQRIGCCYKVSSALVPIRINAKRIERRKRPYMACNIMYRCGRGWT